MSDKDTGAPATGTPDAPPATGGNTPPTAPATGAPAVPVTGPATTPPTTPAAPALTPEQIQELLASNERMQTALNAANKEAEKTRRKAKEDSDALLPENERIAAENAALKAEKDQWAVERATLAVESQVAALTQKLGLINPAIVAKLVDFDALDFKDGMPTNVEAVVTTLVQANPFLVGRAPVLPGRTGLDAGQGTGAGTPPNLSAAELEAAKEAGISPDRYEKLKSVQTLEDWKKTRVTPGT